MSEQNTPGDGQHRLAEEARLLLDAVAERVQPWLQRLASEAPGDGHSPASCGWCPLCAAVAVVRGERPELAVRAAEHLAGLLGTLRSAMAERVPAPGRDTPRPEAAGAGGAAPGGAESDSADPAEESARQPEPPVAPRVQRITVEREC